ncbi:MAG TPA: hypothetical protein VGL59_26070 [Polyangia bacterium]|jgi:hypothetical protein
MAHPDIAEVGEKIERSWSARDYDASAFPAICADVLTVAGLHRTLAPKAILDWALQGDLPRQADPEAAFGQPPITLFRARRFYIDALFWVDGTTSVHDHGFSGAFQVLSGSSIETTFAFDETRDVDGQLRFGALRVLGTQLLQQGDVQPIAAGPTFIHSLFHLPRPAVSLVARTFSDVNPGVQLSYLPPGIAHNSFHADQTLDRLLQIVELLRSTDDPTFETRTGDLIASSDLHTAFSIVKACEKTSDRSRLARLIGRVRDPEARPLLAAWAASAERIRFLQTRRALVHDPDLRFMLAVLLNAHRRQDALSLVSAYATTLPASRQIAAWLAKLATVTARLQLASGPWEPNLLGLPSFTARREEALAAALGDQQTSSMAEEADFLGQLRSLPHLQPLFR